jgi:hypothetical protein
MIPRVVAPAPEVEYFLDAAQEAAEMDSCTAMTLRLYGNDDELLAIINRDRLDPGHGRIGRHFLEHRKICLDLAAVADRIIPQLPEQRRSGLVRIGLKHLVFSVHDLAETMACWTIEDEIEGGCMLPFRTSLRSKRGVPFKRISRRLRSANYIRRYVKVHAPEHADHLLSLRSLMLKRAGETAPTTDDGVFADYRNQLNAVRQRMEFASRRSWIKPITRKDRKVIRKSIAFAEQLLGRDTVATFLRGEEVRLIGNEAMLVLRKRGRLTDTGHGCISIAIADRNGTQLADLCTYIENTPMLDQLSGFALWMKAGEERRVFETANIIRLADGCNDHPLVAQRREAIREREAARPLVDVEAQVEAIMDAHLKHKKPRRFARQLSHEETRARNMAYWEETKAIWIEAMMVFVFGYRNFPTLKTAGAI